MLPPRVDGAREAIRRRAVSAADGEIATAVESPNHPNFIVRRVGPVSCAASNGATSERLLSSSPGRTFILCRALHHPCADIAAEKSPKEPASSFRRCGLRGSRNGCSLKTHERRSSCRRRGADGALLRFTDATSCGDPGFCPRRRGVGAAPPTRSERAQHWIVLLRRRH